MLPTTEDLRGDRYGTLLITEFKDYHTWNGGVRRVAFFEAKCEVCHSTHILPSKVLVRVTDPYLGQKCSCDQIPSLSLSGIQAQHLKNRQKAMGMSTMSPESFAYLSLAPCSVCGKTPQYPTLNKLKSLQNGAVKVVFCPDCYQKRK